MILFRLFGPNGAGIPLPPSQQGSNTQIPPSLHSLYPHQPSSTPHITPLPPYLPNSGGHPNLPFHPGGHPPSLLPTLPLLPHHRQQHQQGGSPPPVRPHFLRHNSPPRASMGGLVAGMFGGQGRCRTPPGLTRSPPGFSRTPPVFPGRSDSPVEQEEHDFKLTDSQNAKPLPFHFKNSLFGDPITSGSKSEDERSPFHQMLLNKSANDISPRLASKSPDIDSDN